MNEIYENLNEQIVLALGWKAVKVDPPIIYEGNDAYAGHYRIVCEWTVVDHHGEKQVRPWQDEELAWEHVEYPDFKNDANAQLAVCAERGWRFSVGMARGLAKQPFRADIHGIDSALWEGYGATPQEAGARALLAALTAESEAAT